MDKEIAIKILGGSPAIAAQYIGVSRQAINCWPEELPPRIVDRVFAAVVRQHPEDWQAIWPEPVVSHRRNLSEVNHARSIRSAR